MNPLSWPEFQIPKEVLGETVPGPMEEQEIVLEDQLQPLARDIEYLDRYINEAGDDEERKKRGFEAIQALNDVWQHMGDQVQTFGRALSMNGPPKFILEDNMTEVLLSYGEINHAEITGVSHGFQFAPDPKDGLTHIWHATMPSSATVFHEPGYQITIQQRILTRPGEGYVLPYDAQDTEAQDMFDELYDEFPDIMVEIDAILDASESLPDRLNALGNMILPFEAMEEMIYSKYSEFINDILGFGELPLVIKNCELIAEYVEGDEDPYHAIKRDGSTFLAKPYRLVGMPVWEEGADPDEEPESCIFAIQAMMYFQDREFFGAIPLKSCIASDLQTLVQNANVESPHQL